MHLHSSLGVGGCVAWQCRYPYVHISQCVHISTAYGTVYKCIWAAYMYPPYVYTERELNAAIGNRYQRVTASSHSSQSVFLAPMHCCRHGSLSLSTCVECFFFSLSLFSKLNVIFGSSFYLDGINIDTWFIQTPTQNYFDNTLPPLDAPLARKAQLCILFRKLFQSIFKIEAPSSCHSTLQSL